MDKQQLRPKIDTIVISNKMSPEEKFQNEVLRPILKLQHELLIASFQESLTNSKTILTKMEVTQKNEFIKKHLVKNIALKNQIIGMITGLFTPNEFSFYSEKKSEYGKRIIQMSVKRLQDSY